MTGSVYAEVIGGSGLMAAGAVAIALSSASDDEYSSWREAAQREIERYGIDPEYVYTRVMGHEFASDHVRRTWSDWLLVGVATLIFIGLGAMAHVPAMEIHMGWLFALSLGMVLMLLAGVLALWRVTKFA